MNGVWPTLPNAMKSRKMEREKYSCFKKPKIIKIALRSSEIGPFEIWDFVHELYYRILKISKGQIISKITFFEVVFGQFWKIRILNFKRTVLEGYWKLDKTVKTGNSL